VWISEQDFPDSGANTAELIDALQVWAANTNEAMGAPATRMVEAIAALDPPARSAGEAAERAAGPDVNLDAVDSAISLGRDREETAFTSGIRRSGFSAMTAAPSVPASVATPPNRTMPISRSRPGLLVSEE
jgi:hypothetical protein